MNRRRLSILYVGVAERGSTSLQRADALRTLGHWVSLVEGFPKRNGFFARIDNWLYRKGFEWAGHRSPAVNRAILGAARTGKLDLLWLDKSLYVSPETLASVKLLHPGLRVLGYSPDYMEARHNNSRWFVAHSPAYDLFVTTKSYAVPWHEKVGCKKVLFIDNAYDPATHRPVRLAPSVREKMGGPVGFIGTYERDRAEDLDFLGGQGVPVLVYGATWFGKKTGPGVRVVPQTMLADDYARVINAFDINLCFLKKMNFDLQTSRSIEIPACGAFMLAERTSEHEALFKEGKEAEFFGDRDELLEKCRFYLAHPAERKRIAAAGRRRCVRSGYDNPARLAKVLDTLYGHGRRAAA